MKAALALALLAAVAPAQQITGWSRQHNTIRLALDAGAMDIEFLSPSAFRVTRGLAGPPAPATGDAVNVRVTPNAQGMQFATDDLWVQAHRAGALLTVSLAGGTRLFAESRAQIAEGKAELVLETRAMESFLGLGARPDANADARGMTLTPSTPFFIAGHSGYAFWVTASTPIAFDLGKTHSGQVRIEGAKMERLEYFVAFGPSVKEIWDERLKAVGAPQTPATPQLELIAGSQLPSAATRIPQTNVCGDARALVHASLSGTPMPAFDLGHYRDADLATYRRAARLGSFAPIFYDSNPASDPAKLALAKAAASYRHQLSLFLLTYADEVRARGYPVLHPLMHQFPRDPVMRQQINAFMFGDELLVIPTCEAGMHSVYLPQGIWTDLRTEQEHKGRQNITIDAPEDGVLVLAKNGAIMPLGNSDVTELHYYPRLGGEFFFFEPEVGDYSQVHAGPAADIYRVQIETKVSRKYEWVIHHMEKPKAVELVEKGPVDWRYDAGKRTVRFVVDAKAGTDLIHNILF